MSSPANVTIKNFYRQSVVTSVTRDYWVEGDGKSIDGKVIPAGGEETYEVVAKTGHHGELDINLLDGENGIVLGVFKIRSIKDPQEGEKSLEVIPGLETNFNMCAMGHRSSPGNADLRRIGLTVA